MLTSRGHAIGQFTDDAVSLAARALSGVNHIRKLINVDHKVSSVSSTGLAGSQAGVGTYLCPIGAGTDASDRIGDSIKVQSLTLRCIVQRAGADASLRIIILRDMENRQATPSGTDVLSLAGTAASVVSRYNYFNHNPNANPNRFVFLVDELISVSTNEPYVAYTVTVPGKHVRFSGTGNTTGNAAEGAYFLFLFTDAAANQPTLNFCTELFYTDD